MLFWVDPGDLTIMLSLHILTFLIESIFLIGTCLEFGLF